MKDSNAEPTTVQELVAANHILYEHEVVDGFGHVSVRHDTEPNRFWLSRSMAPILVTAEDILEFDLDGNAIFNPQERAVYLERFIHAEIYRRRPDVKAVVHSHAPVLIPFGVTKVTLKPVFHMSAFLGTGIPVFEIREHAGNTDMLIRNPSLGAALAETLGDNPAALMRGHGAVAVGHSLPHVVYRAIYLGVNARLQAEAMRLGDINFLTPEEAALASDRNDSQLSRPWALWKHEVE